MKKIAAVGLIASALILTTCTSTFAGATTQNTIEKTIYKLLSTEPRGIIEITAAKVEAEIQAKNDLKARLVKNKTLINAMIQKLKGQVGVTPYVPYSMSTSGWDCSGMVSWAYKQIGINLYHGATHQRHSGQIVNIPQIGDVVVFGWADVYDTQHSGIYIGNDTMIHAGGQIGDYTELMSVSKWAKSNGNTYVTYTRILPN